MQQKVMKLISILLLTTILYANFATVISFAADKMLSSKEIENQGISTQNPNVEFDVFYEGGKHSAELDVNDVDTKLNIAINLKNASILKDIVVDLSNSNFKISQSQESENIQLFNQEEKKIVFNQITKSTNLIEKINIAMDKKNIVTEDAFDRDNVIKLTATYINQKAEEVKISKDIIIHTSWKATEAKAKLEYNTIKFIPYEMNNESKLIVAGEFISYLENSVLPIQETKIEINAQKINNEYPERVVIIADSTQATNGEVDAKNFSNNNWSYDNATGKININVKNDIKDGTIQWNSNVIDKFYITYIYSENVCNSIKDKKVRLEYNINSNLVLYGNGIKNVSASKNNGNDQIEKIGDILDLNIKQTQTLNKGYLYSNKKAIEENKKETDYKVEYIAKVFYKDVIDEINIKEEVSQFVNTNGKEESTIVGENNYVYNKELKISKQDFDKFIGEKGKIEILNSTGEILETINKDSIVDNNNIVVNLLKYNVNNVNIKTSKPQSEGNIKFEITKTLNKNIDYSSNQIKTFSDLKTSVTTILKNNTTEIVKLNTSSNISLEEPIEKVGAEINNNRLSTIVKNENIKLKVILENDSIDDVLYENPTIDVKLPSNIKILNIKNSQVYFDDELNINNTEVINNKDGTKSILVNLQGTQTKYNNSAAKGAVIELDLDIELNRLTPTTDTNIVIVATNKDGTKVIKELPIKLVAPTGVVATNAMTGYNGQEKLEVINGEAKEVLISTKVQEKELTFNMNVINNYENTIDNIVVLGRIPFAGNKNIDNSDLMGSTMDMPLKGKIQLEGNASNQATIYYSENGEATKDLEKVENAWKTEVVDYAKIKSYMIKIDNYAMTTGEYFAFNYKVTLKGDLDYDKSAYENYAVYFNNNKKSGTIQDKVIATKIGVTTGSTAKIEAKLISPMEGKTIKAGEDLEYILTVTNSGSLDANNVEAVMNYSGLISYIPEEGADANSYKEERLENLDKVLTLNLGNIKAKTSCTKKIKFNVYVETPSKDISFKAKVKYDNKEVETNAINTKIAKTYFKLYTTTYSEHQGSLREGDTYSYAIHLRATDYNLRNNTIVKIKFPEELNYESIEVQRLSVEMNKFVDLTPNVKTKVKGNDLTIELGTVTKEEEIVVLNFKVKNNKLQDYQKDIVINASVQADGTDVENVDEVKETLNKVGVRINQICNIPENMTISGGEKFKYIFTIENLSDISLDDMIFEEIVPQGIVITSVKAIYQNGTIDNDYRYMDNNNTEIDLYIIGKTTVTVEVEAYVKYLDTDTKIDNKAKIRSKLIGEMESNTLSHTIKATIEEENPEIENPEIGNKETRKIIGTIWKDLNKDGVKDVNEEKVQNVSVLLLDNKTGNVALDSYNKELIVTTNENGSYMFNNVLPGRYSVIFFYDSMNYSPTEYHKQGVNEAINSDGIDRTIIYEGKTQIAAMTEEIVIEKENKYDIDLGIIENPKFDLKLDKQVKNITVNDTKKVSKHEYNSNFAKIDFEGKYAAKSSMVVEYKISVTNEGGIPGYVKKVADYLPSELKFNSELNKDWYLGKDGVLYNNSLANTIIKPGETKELSLLLTKSMNSEDFGIINNSAEIYETSNDYGALDIDSTVANKNTNEDDYATANVLTSIKTGGIVVYTTLAITVITIIGVGLYMIKKKVLK